MPKGTPSRGFRPRRALGQTFLHDGAIRSAIVDAITPRPEDVLLEIGAGRGELTLPLAAAGVRWILTLEADAALVEELRRVLEAKEVGRIEVLHADFLQVDLGVLLDRRGFGSATRLRVVGNLPYSAASPILLKLLTVRDRLEDMTLMFQEEVAQRLIARPGTKAYGYLSVVTQQASRARLLLGVPPGAFWPRPKVHSALVRLEFLREREPPVGDPELFHALVKGLLSHRRKTISNNIKRLKSSLVEIPVLLAALEKLRIDPRRRAEALSVEEFAAISDFCSSRR
ncbi:MAG: 16S rRNA (adenine(1518)-N(6)/adenine(1519)-N(6))-dimethyltransferase RsmA [Acidobacteriota bacterium]